MLLIQQHDQKLARDTKTKMLEDARWKDCIIKVVGYRRLAVGDSGPSDYTNFLEQLSHPVPTDHDDNDTLAPTPAEAAKAGSTMDIDGV